MVMIRSCMAQAMGPRMRSVPKNKAFYGESQSAGASGTCALASAESTATIAHAVVMRRDIVDDCTGTVLSVLVVYSLELYELVDV